MMIKRILAPAILIGIYLCFALYKLKYPGLQYDETLFGNAALGLDTCFRAYSFKGFPVLVMAYIGALKSWIYTPIFYLFGVNPYSIRVPMVLLGACSLLFLFKLIQKRLGLFAALLLLFSFVTDPAFVLLTRIDVGPSGIEFFLKCLLIGMVVLYAETKSFRYLLLYILVYLTGVFNKANFVWYNNAAILVIVYWFFSGNWKSYFLKKEFQLFGLATFVAFLCSTVYMLGVNYKFGSFISGNLGFHLLKTMPLRQALRTSHGVISLLAGDLKLYPDNPPYFYHGLSSSINYYFVAILGFGSLLAYLFIGNKRQITGVVLLIIIGLVLQIFVSGSDRPWHLFVIYPFVQLFIVLVGLQIKEHNEKLWILFISAFCVLTIPKIYTNYKYMMAYGNKPSVTANWSSEIYNLSNYAKQSPKKFYIMDWGVASQLSTLCNEKGKVQDVGLLQPGDYLPEGKKIFVSQLMQDKPSNIEVVMRLDTTENYTTARWGQREEFKKVLAENHLTLQKMTLFSELNTPIYQTYLIVPAK